MRRQVLVRVVFVLRVFRRRRGLGHGPRVERRTDLGQLVFQHEAVVADESNSAADEDAVKEGGYSGFSCRVHLCGFCGMRKKDVDVLWMGCAD